MSTAAHAATMVFDAAQIQRMLPHKYPFLLLDGAHDVIPGVSGRGHKFYSINEWFFVGHFPGEPIVPGVLIIESLAQLTAVIYLASALAAGGAMNPMAGSGGPAEIADLSSLASKVGYLVKANVKFMSPVRPGTRLDLLANIVKRLGSLSLVDVRATEGRAVAVEGELSVSERG